MTESHFLNDLNDLDLNDRFFVSSATFTPFSCSHCILAVKLR